MQVDRPNLNIHYQYWVKTFVYTTSDPAGISIQTQFDCHMESFRLESVSYCSTQLAYQLSVLFMDVV